MLMAALVVASAATGSAQIHLRPGEYESTIEMNVAGVPRADQQALSGFLNQKSISRECKSADEVGDGNAIAKWIARGDDEVNCKASDIKIAGNKITFTSTCVEDGQRLTGNTEMTFGVDSYVMVMTMKDADGKTNTIKQTAKRIGECKK
jgi:hypothetical protein